MATCSSGRPTSSTDALACLADFCNDDDDQRCQPTTGAVCSIIRINGCVRLAVRVIASFCLRAFVRAQNHKDRIDWFLIYVNDIRAAAAEMAIQVLDVGGSDDCGCSPKAIHIRCFAQDGNLHADDLLRTRCQPYASVIRRFNLYR